MGLLIGTAGVAALTAAARVVGAVFAPHLAAGVVDDLRVPAAADLRMEQGVGDVTKESGKRLLILEDGVQVDHADTSAGLILPSAMSSIRP